eukprot:12233246-Alexandrium_andersonii.AAC.1
MAADEHGEHSEAGAPCLQMDVNARAALQSGMPVFACGPSAQKVSLAHVLAGVPGAGPSGMNPIPNAPIPSKHCVYIFCRRGGVIGRNQP